MTSMQRLLSIALLCLGSPGALASPSPTIFHVSESAKGGDIIGIQGDAFGPQPQAWLQRVEAGTSKLSPATAKQMQLVNRSTNYVSALIPETEQVGVYAIWIKSGSGYSEPALVNVARAWGANDLGGTQIDPGRGFRLFGRNLYLGSGHPTVRFVDDKTTLEASVITRGSDANMLRLNAPGQLVPGKTYTVQVNNGYGGEYGTTSLRYTLTARASGTDAFGLGVPWGSEFSSIAANLIDVKTHGAVGDGKADDTVAIQSAIDAASADGGGTVFFPAGTYKIVYSAGNTKHSMLDLKSNVVLKGESRDRSRIVLTGSTPDSRQYAFGILGYGVHHSGFAHIGIENTETGAPTTVFWRVGSEKLFMIDCQMRIAGGKGISSQNSNQIVIKRNVIDNDASNSKSFPSETVWMVGSTDLIFSNNDLSWYFKRIRTTRGQRLLIEGNRYQRIAIQNDTRLESGVIETSQTDSAIILDNTITKGGRDPLIQNGDGETIMAQGGPSLNRDIGNVSSATATSLTDLSKKWDYDYSQGDADMSSQHYYVAIVNGPGMGQLRELSADRPNTGNTLYISDAWQVLPAVGSRYSIIRCDACRHLVKGNHLSGNLQGLEYYAGNFWDISFISNDLNDNGAIWIRSDYRPNTTPPTFQITRNLQIFGNHVRNQRNTYSLPGSYSRLLLETWSAPKVGFPAFFGTNLVGIDAKDNSLSAPQPNQYQGANGEGYTIKIVGPHQQDDSVNVLGTIFQRNAASNTDSAFHLSPGARSTAIWESRLKKAGSLLSGESLGIGDRAKLSGDTQVDSLDEKRAP